MEKEYAFRIDPNSDFHKQYFRMREEKQKFCLAGKEFFQSHGFSDKGRYMIAETLHAELSPEDEQRFAGQIKAQEDGYGMRIFKKRSEMQRAWLEEVVAAVDMKIVQSLDFWWIDFISCGRYALWDHAGMIYGYLADKYGGEVKLADFMEPLKMSEYYRIIEEEEAARKEKAKKR